MPVHATTMEILTEKARFDPPTAFALAEAMDNTIKETQLVTVPVFESEIRELRKDMNAGFAELRREMNAGLTDLRREMDVRFEKMLLALDAKFASHRSNMLRWLIGSIASLAALMIAVIAIAV